MKVKKCFKNRFKQAFLRYFFAFLLIISGVFGTIAGGLMKGGDAYAEPDVTTPTVIVPDNNVTTDGVDTTEPTTIDPNNDTTDDATDGATNTTTDTTATTASDTSGGVDECQNSLGAIGWLVCPTTGKIAEAVDWLYGKIEGILIINPIESKDGSPIYEIWKYCRGLTNIVFIIFMLVVIYSQITGYGITNYGLKKALPKLIVAAVFVNLSFLICQLGVDLSNIIGSSLRGLFDSVQQTAVTAMQITPEAAESMNLMYSELYGILAGGSILAIGAAFIAFETGAIWMLIPIVLGALVAVASGLITIALRQALVALLVMIAPLAIVANILPNTEGLFKKWKNLLIQMLVFYPMFSLLFGASSLAGFAIIASAKDAFWILLGMAVQVFPLFFSWTLMKMSGTVLGTINTKLRGLAAGPLSTNKAWADSRRQFTKQRMLASSRARTPSLKLMQFMSNRKLAREEETKEYAATVKNRALAYNASKHYKKDGSASRDGMKAYKMQAENMGYAETIERDKNNMNKGLGMLAAQPKSALMRARLQQLDVENVTASDRLKVEKARGEVIEFENAMGFHKRMEDAINAHMDDKYGYETDKNGNKTKRSDYKFHFSDANEVAGARARYSAMNKIMEGSELNTQYAAATAAQSFDTQKKIIETKMGKYFELTPPTQDVVYRIREFARSGLANQNIDSIISGLRILNQRGDTDLLKDALDDVLKEGVTLGTHTSQALASFLMFEVKDNDPFLRRFGKYINLETAKVYNKNERKETRVTFDEYVTGRHVEPNGETMYAKRPMSVLVEGTSLDNIERTALSNLDSSLMKVYTKDGKLDIDAYLKKREEIQTAIGPAFISASLKYLSGSEQLKSAVSFLTGYSYSQKKDKNGKTVVDEDGNPVYEWKARWEENGDLSDDPKRAKKYFGEKTEQYFKDQTPTQILGLRSDYKDPVAENLIDSYFEKVSKTEEGRRQRAEYDRELAEIQTRYGDLPPKEAAKKRKADTNALKMKFAGAEFRNILDSKGKLEQIYRTRRSGAANNAKDWVRDWLKLDNENGVLEFLDKKRIQRERTRSSEPITSETDGDEPIRVNPVYNEEFRVDFMNGMENLYERCQDMTDEEFYEETLKYIKKHFGNSHIIYELYKEYHETNRGHLDKNDYYEYLESLIYDEKNYD